MIALYQFDNANVSGDKEAVVVPNVPTLVNKLSANETNNIRDKINEIINLANPVLTPIAYLDLRLSLKGAVGGVPNTLATLQAGDRVHGFADATTVWQDAIYNGGDVNDRVNYTPQTISKPEPILRTAPITGAGQTFIIPVGFKVGSVLKSKGELFKGSEWSQTSDVLTIIINANIGNTVYIKPE